jgi:hypothetical protein
MPLLLFLDAVRGGGMQTLWDTHTYMPPPAARLVEILKIELFSKDAVKHGYQTDF